ncbi:MAG: arginine deiminase family protein [Acidimicrobiia bacterium]
MPIAMLRGVPDTFDRAITRDPAARPDVALARSQHDVYSRRLSEAGFDIELLPPDDRFPDSVFIEDAAVVVGAVAVITRPGAVSRKGETTAVADRLSRHFRLAEIEPPGTIDGGDVLMVGRNLYVGLSERTSRNGIDQLTAVARDQDMDVVTVPVVGALHLKSVVLPVAEETVVVTEGTVDVGLFDGLEIIREDPTERMQFSALPLGGDRVLVTASAPRTAGSVEKRGLETVPIDISEFQTADGGLTCMSILFDQAI